MELSIIPAGYILYDNQLMIPKQTKHLVIESVQQNHPNQAGMLKLADLVWFPCIHRAGPKMPLWRQKT